MWIKLNSYSFEQWRKRMHWERFDSECELLQQVYILSSLLQRRVLPHLQDIFLWRVQLSVPTGRISGRSPLRIRMAQEKIRMHIVHDTEQSLVLQKLGPEFFWQLVLYGIRLLNNILAVLSDCTWHRFSQLWSEFLCLCLTLRECCILVDNQRIIRSRSLCRRVLSCDKKWYKSGLLNRRRPIFSWKLCHIHYRQQMLCLCW